MLGYLFQVRYALLALLSSDGFDTQLYVEQLDDVVTENPGATKLEQLKHSTKSGETINGYSVELWKTLRIYCEAYSAGWINPAESMLCLITTATVEPGSPPALLKKDQGRNESKAKELLKQIAQTARNQTLEKAYSEFKKLEDEDLDRLLACIVVIDESFNIADVPQKIKQLFNGVKAAHCDPVYERLEGWWFDLVVKHLLDSSKDPISKAELKEYLADIDDQFGLDRLSLDYEDHTPTAEEIEDSRKRMFVRQMNAVQLHTTRIRLAIENYYRALEQRARWVRDLVLVDAEELERYEKRLIREWELIIATLEDDGFAVETDEEQIAFGKKVLTLIEALNLPIRSNMPPGHLYIVRGTYHILADRNKPAVYWHPKFLDKLKALETELATVTAR